MPRQGAGTQRQPQVKLTASAFCHHDRAAGHTARVASRVCACRPSAEVEHRLKLRCGSEGCDQRRTRQGSLPGDELAAPEMLAKNWAQYSCAHKTQCVAMTTQGGPSYVELISCLEIMRDADAIRNAAPSFGLTDQDPKRAPRTTTMRGRSKR